MFGALSSRASSLRRPQTRQLGLLRSDRLRPSTNGARAMINDTEPSPAAHSNGNAAAPRISASSSERADLLNIAEGLSVGRGIDERSSANMAEQMLLRRAWHNSLAAPMQLPRIGGGSGNTASTPALSLAHPISPSSSFASVAVYSAAFGVERATASLEAHIAEGGYGTMGLAQSQLTASHRKRGSQAPGGGHGHHATAALAAVQRHEEALALHQERARAAVAAWVDVEAVREGMALLAAGSGSADSHHNATVLAEQIRLGLGAAVSATTAPSCDIDVLVRIMKALRADCATADHAVRQKRKQAAVGTSSNGGGAGSESAPQGYFIQSLRRICNSASPTVLPTLAIALGAAASAMGPIHHDEGEGAAQALVAEMGVILSSVLVVVKSTQIKVGATARGAGGHLSTTATSVLIGINGAIDASIASIAAATLPRAGDEEGVPLLPLAGLSDAVVRLSLTLVELAQTVGSFPTLARVHDGLVRAMGHLDPPSRRVAALVEAQRAENALSPSEGAEAEAAWLAAQTESARSVALRAITAIVTSASAAVEDASGSAPTTTTARHLVQYYSALLRAISAIARRNAPAVVIATTPVVDDGGEGRNITAEGAVMSLDALEIVSLVIDNDHHHDANGGEQQQLAHIAREALGASLDTLSKTHPRRVVTLFEAGTIEGSSTVADAHIALGEVDKALALITAIGESKGEEGWPTPPPAIIATMQRVALAIGHDGAPRHLALLASAVFAFRSPHMWLGVYLDFVTVGLAVRVQRHTALCDRTVVGYTKEATMAHDKALDAFVASVRDVVTALALQRSADVSADPLLELLQECCWHPRAEALVLPIVEHHAHLFACYPSTYEHKLMVNVPKEHKSRSRQFGAQPFIAPPSEPMRLVGSYLQHAVLSFLRDNRQSSLLRSLGAAWAIPLKDVDALQCRDKDVAPGTQLWECRSCKRLNNSRYMYCSCSALRYGSVVCPTCGTGQPETGCACAACGHSFAAIADDFVVPRVPWSCAGCGAANSAYQTTFCGKCKTATGPLANALVRSETCSACDAPNPMGFALYPTCPECGTNAKAFSMMGAADHPPPSAESGEPAKRPAAGAKAWKCDSCGLWAPTTLSRCPHCPFVELRGTALVRSIAPITCSSCGTVNANGLQSHCDGCDSVLEGNLPTTVDLCTECFSANTHGASGCGACDAPFETTLVDGSTEEKLNHITVKSYFRYCRSCHSSVSPYNLSCVCDRCNAFLPFYTTPHGEPVPNAAPDAVGVVATCETILRRIDKEGEGVLIPIADGFLMELTAATDETIAIARPLLTDVVVHFGQVFALNSLAGCRGLAITLALAHHAQCEITEGRLVDLDRRVVTAFNKQRDADDDASHRAAAALSPIASFVAGSSSDATAHNTASLLFSSAFMHTTPSEANAVIDAPSDEEQYLNHHTHEQQQLCRNCLSPHAESMCRFNSAGWTCEGCGKVLSNSNGLDGVMCPSCYQVRPELDDCLEVWQCPECTRCSPETELFCLYCNTHKETAARRRAEGVYLLPFLPVACGRCSRPHLEAHCPYCTAVPPTRVTNGIGTVTVVTDRYAFVQPMGTCSPDARVFVPLQLAGDSFEGQQVIFDAEEGKPGQLRATRLAAFDD